LGGEFGEKSSNAQCQEFVLILTRGNQNIWFVLVLTLKTEGRFDLDFGVSKQQQQSATVCFKSCQVQQLFQVVSSVCFDFVPGRGSPEDNKVWLTLTFSCESSLRRSKQQQQSLKMSECNLVASRILFRHQQSEQRRQGLFGFDFQFRVVIAWIETTTTKY
jgi:hypothetical protein